MLLTIVEPKVSDLDQSVAGAMVRLHPFTFKRNLKERKFK